MQHNDLHLNKLIHEPKIALTSSESGLSDIKKIIQESSKVLKRGGILIIEHGYNQEDQVKNLFKDNYFLDIFNIKDYQGLPRITYGIIDK